ncbi:HAD family hydrolase [Anaerorhabdus sp.]|uniref:HAD family hydrolase n=1 Tax=Anaerorhabdus sp. TaxID=1872524 RepID=UPI002FC62C01
MNDNIEWIFFDVGSTLVDEINAFHMQIKNTIEGTNISFDTFYEKIEELLLDGKPGYRGACEYYQLARKPWVSDREELYKDTIEVLDYLKNKYKLGIIANQLLGLSKRLERQGILHYFDVIVSSAEEGIEKPDLRIFELALSRSGCNPQQAIMIGDRIDNDIEPAKKCNMHTVWIQRNQEMKDSNHLADYKILNLKELIKIL